MSESASALLSRLPAFAATGLVGRGTGADSWDAKMARARGAPTLNAEHLTLNAEVPGLMSITGGRLT